MTERPILFSGEMVRALLAGTKRSSKLYAHAGDDPRQHLARRLLNGISRISDHGCFIWGRTTSAGYGSMTVNGKTIRVHRIAMAFAIGCDERELDEVCHDCPGGDEPLCLNQRHLFHGTHGDNVMDAIAKGRAVPPTGPAYRGSANPASKLTDAQVAEIRSALSRRDLQRVIAARFGVSQPLVSAIANGKVRNA